MSFINSKTQIPLLVLFVLMVVLLFLPVRSEELYGYNAIRFGESGTVTPDVYSSEVTKPLVVSIVLAVNGNNALDAESRLDIIRNCMVLIIPGLLYFAWRAKQSKRSTKQRG